jgi:hypothetical protein
MQISLEPSNVVTALNKYLNDIGIQTAGQTVTYSFRNKRKGDKGVHALVTITPDVTPFNVIDIPTVTEEEAFAQVANEESEVVVVAEPPKAVSVPVPASLFD